MSKLKLTFHFRMKIKPMQKTQQIKELHQKHPQTHQIPEIQQTLRTLHQVCQINSCFTLVIHPD